jgi:hypothetical protein
MNQHCCPYTERIRSVFGAYTERVSPKIGLCLHAKLGEQKPSIIPGSPERGSVPLPAVLKGTLFPAGMPFSPGSAATTGRVICPTIVVSGLPGMLVHQKHKPCLRSETGALRIGAGPVDGDYSGRVGVVSGCFGSNAWRKWKGIWSGVRVQTDRKVL